MNEPWIPQWGLLIIFHVILVLLALPLIILAELFVPKGKAKTLTLGIIVIGFVVTFILFVFGVVAYLFGQPPDVWRVLVFLGLEFTVALGLLYRQIRKKYREAELRKLMAEDLTLESNGHRHNNKEEVEVSDE